VSNDVMSARRVENTFDLYSEHVSEYYRSIITFRKCVFKYFWKKSRYLNNNTNTFKKLSEYLKILCKKKLNLDLPPCRIILGLPRTYKNNYWRRKLLNTVLLETRSSIGARQNKVDYTIDFQCCRNSFFYGHRSAG